MTRHRTLLSAAVLCLAIGSPAPAMANQIMNGTWSGKARCSGPYLDARPRVTYETTLEITQFAGGELAARLTLEAPESSITVNQCGAIVESQGRANVALATPLTPYEILLAASFTSVKTFPANSSGHTGRLKGAGPVLQTSQDIAISCRYSLARISTANPNRTLIPCDG
jgi:hypothetical protein